MSTLDGTAGTTEGGPHGRPCHVLKFGGTSVATLARWQQIAAILRARVEAELDAVLVCSAVAGVTDKLERAIAANRADADTRPLMSEIRGRHEQLANELGVDVATIAKELAALEQLLAGPAPTPAREAEIMSFGELMSTRLGAAWLTSQNIECAWIDARELLTSIAQEAERPEHYLSASCEAAPNNEAQQRVRSLGARVVITQGYIARSPCGETVLLGRGGSDTSAAYLASVLAADRLEIWTDVPGLFTANPRLIPEARLLRQTGYREAQALGALGAAVLHPRAIEAVWEHGIPIELGWTAHPEVKGTSINASRASRGAKAITSRRHLAMFALRRPPSWQPVAFLADVAACFATRGLSMDLVSSSCSEIRVTVDLDAFPSAETEIPDILEELSATCHPRVINPVASVSVVGARVGQSLLGSENAFGLFADEALFMVVHAADEHHVSFVLEPHAAERLVRAAHEQMMAEEDRHDLGPTWRELTAPEAHPAKEPAA